MEEESDVHRAFTTCLSHPEEVEMVVPVITGVGDGGIAMMSIARVIVSLVNVVVWKMP